MCDAPGAQEEKSCCGAISHSPPCLPPHTPLGCHESFLSPPRFQCSMQLSAQPSQIRAAGHTGLPSSRVSLQLALFFFFFQSGPFWWVGQGPRKLALWVYSLHYVSNNVSKPKSGSWYLNQSNQSDLALPCACEL